VAILGIPVIVKRPWVITTVDGADSIAVRPILRLALTFDHRAVDGAYATRYIVRVKEYLEQWDVDEYQ
jgi:pyruvate dehydrogenase E2 component (dihydrolipoamide acetyltransferase)